MQNEMNESLLEQNNALEAVNEAMKKLDKKTENLQETTERLTPKINPLKEMMARKIKTEFEKQMRESRQRVNELDGLLKKRS